MKKIVLNSLFLFFLLFFTSKVNASSEYNLRKYDINIVVNENNTLAITENITAHFNINKHGIFRKIPLRNKITRLDGSTSSNKARLSELKISDPHTISNANGYKTIKLGDPEIFLIGDKNYSISYLYDLGQDKSKDFDEFYFNIIGNDWDTSIRNITFSIKLPKDFDPDKLGFSSGSIGSTTNKNISYSIEDNIIKGNYQGTLNPGEGLTIRLELPADYFLGARSNIDLYKILTISLSIIFAIISFFIWKKFGQDDLVIETVEFYPPENFNSAEIAFLYNGKVENSDIVSLLVYLADKGYIKITESAHNSFELTELKKYDSENENEKIFLEGLFARKNTLSSTLDLSSIAKTLESIIVPTSISTQPDDSKDKNSPQLKVTSSDLKDSFYITLDKIKANMNTTANREKIFEKSSLMTSGIILFMIFIDFIMLGFLVISETYPDITTLSEPIYIITYTIGFICILIMTIVYLNSYKRSAYGSDILGKIKGFKNFLETAEKPKLEELVMENPTYFYNILPYTYVLGVSSKWINKFVAITLQPPSWYAGSNAFDALHFGYFMNQTMSSATQAMTSNPSSDSSGSSFSGGGFSGGGSGGGGGGSW